MNSSRIFYFVSTLSTQTKADISQLMNLIMTTFYSNKEIFLRELISNSLDALEKIRYEAMTDPSKLEVNSGGPRELFIRITPDKPNRVLSIRDSGVGMTKADLVNNLGTIMKSGTREFMETVSLQSAGEEGTDMSMKIGQFGMGFYSVFLVADRVQVISKHNDDDDQYVWESSGDASFSITKDRENEALGRGTEVRLFLKEDKVEYLEATRIREVVKKYSEFIGYPIQLAYEQKQDRPTQPTTISGRQVVVEVLNLTKPLWNRNPDEISFEMYALFYKAMTNDWDNHLAVRHFLIEGQLEFHALLYVPSRAPFDLFLSTPLKAKRRKNIKLYVRRVFVMDDSEELLPEWLMFVRGVVDSEDLPLNISREKLQQNRILKFIRKNLVKKCIEMFSEIAETNSVQYSKFYEAFSKNVKWGIYEEENLANRRNLVELLRFPSTKTSRDEMTSLKEYVERMPMEQREIYLMTGESLAAVEHSPFLEVAQMQMGFEVLFMVDPIDEFVLQQKLKEYDGKKLVSITMDGLFEPPEDDDDKECDRGDEERAEHERLCARIKEILGNRVEEVKMSRRISESPCVVVTEKFGFSANIERILKAGALRDSKATSSSSSYVAKILEVNPKHAIIRSLRRMVKKGKNEELLMKDLVLLMFDVALVVSGFSIEETDLFAKRVYGVARLGLGLYGDIKGGERQERESAEEEMMLGLERLSLEDVVDQQQQN